MFESFDVDLLDTISGCLYYLIILYHVHVSFFIVTHTSCKKSKLPYLKHHDEVLIGKLVFLLKMLIFQGYHTFDNFVGDTNKKDGVRFF